MYLQLFADYRKCQKTDHTCGSGLCIPEVKKCDGYYDCKDKSDEAGCPGKVCDLGQFRCADGSNCVSQYQRCNHRKECSDGSGMTNNTLFHACFSLVIYIAP